MSHVAILMGITLAISIAYVLYKYAPKQYVEHFVDASLSQAYVNAVYDDKGVKPCTVLTSDNYMSTHYVDTLRIKQWKPTDNDPRYKEYQMSHSNSDYCYFFMDDDKKILKTEDFPYGYAPNVDPLANFSNCSKDNTLFKDQPLVQEVFESTGYDKSHNLPYKKCVIKIDKAEAKKEDVVNSFWSNFSRGDAFCEGMAKTLQAEVKSYQDKIKELTKRVAQYRNKYKTPNDLKASLSTCQSTNSQLAGTINENGKQLKNLQNKIQQSNEQYAASIRDLRQQIDALKQQFNVKNSDFTQLSYNQKYILQMDIKELEKSISSMTQKRNKCVTDLTALNTRYNKLKAEHDRVTQEYRQITVDLGSCERELRDTNTAIEEQKPIFMELKKKLVQLKEDLIRCDTDQKSLLKEEAWWRARFKRTSDDYNRCAQARAKLEAQIASLKQEKNALINEIEEIKKRCRDDQSQFNMASVGIHRDASKEIISTEKQRCSASIAMRQRKVELLNEINGILLQANSCDRIVAACKCFKKVAEFPWNDEGVEGSRAWTTSGRIDEIRKHLSAAPFIQFRWTDGRKSGIYQITKTRKKKGGGSYIDIIGAVGANDARTAAMYQQV